MLKKNQELIDEKTLNFYRNELKKRKIIIKMRGKKKSSHLLRILERKTESSKI